MQRNLISVSTMVCVMLVTLSCKKDDSTATQQTASLSATSQTVTEAAGTASITVTLPATQTSDVTVKAALGGTAILNGDYQLATDTTLTIAAGSTSATLTFDIFDDEVVESSKTINVTFSSSNVKLSNSTATITITDNDTDQSSDGLLSELTWDAGTLVDMDLYLVNNLTTTSDGSIDTYNVLSGSTNSTGFESYLLSNDLDDDTYYVVVAYADGSREVNYDLTMKVSGNTILEDSYNFLASEVGYGYFYGPLTKSGTAYSVGKASNSVLWDVKLLVPHLYKGKIAKTK